MIPSPHLLLLPRLLLPGLALAEEGETPQGEASEIIVVESRIDADRPSLRSLRAESLRRQGVGSLADALEASVGVWGAYGGRGERLLTVRGFDQSRMAVFIDGVPTTVPYNGSLDLSKYPSALVDEARVLPGASGSLLGPTGLGGALDIRTEPIPLRPEATARVRSALHGAVDAHASAGGPAGPLGLLLAGGASTSPGYPLSRRFEATPREDGELRDHADERYQDFLAKARADLGSAGGLTASLHGVTGENGVPTGLVGFPVRYWRFTGFTDLGASLAHRRVGDRLSFQETLFYTWNENVLDAFDDAARTKQETGAAFHSLYRDQQVGAAVSLDVLAGPTARPLGLLRTRVFANHQIHHALPDVDEDPVDISTNLLSGALVAESFARRAPRFFAGLEFNAEIPGQETSLDLAPPFVGPVAGLGVQRGERLNVVGSVARRARFPTLKERFSAHRGYSIPNLDLGPESAWHFGLDAALRPVEPLSLTLSVYDAEIQDLIEEVRTSSGEVQLQNTGRARLLGAELLATWTLGTFAELDAAAGRLHARALDREPPEDRLEYRPAWRAKLGLTLRPTDALEAWLGATATGEQSFYDEDTLKWGKLGAFSTFDASVSHRVARRARLGLQARNLLDADVQSKVGYPDPGRELWLLLDLGREVPRG